MRSQLNYKGVVRFIKIQYLKKTIWDELPICHSLAQGKDKKKEQSTCDFNLTIYLTKYN